ncbi:MAG TPA: hypothetical protein VGG86_00220 [Roseiarcus sp.]
MTKTAETMADARTGRRRITKRELAKRDLRLIEKLAAGATIEEIAASEKISLQWARERKRAILAERAIDPPHEFIQVQIRRLSEAMLVAYSAMSLGDLNAVDKVIKVARELDRYDGFGPYPTGQRSAAPGSAPPPLALPEPPAALAPPEGNAVTDQGKEPPGQPNKTQIIYVANCLQSMLQGFRESKNLSAELNGVVSH